MLSFINDVANYAFLQKALLTAIFIGIISGVIGSFIILRGMALLGDAISHAILPGVVISYLIGINYFIGALVMGIFATFLITKVSEKTKLKSDVSIGVVFSSLFALGILLLVKAQTALDLTQILFGNVLTIQNSSMILTLVIIGIVLVVLFTFFKGFLITSFDPIVAKAYGINVNLFHYVLMLLLTLVTVASLETVGVILVVSLLVTPAATAYLLTDKFKVMIFLAAFIGALSSLFGIYLSFVFNLTSGSTIVLVSAVFFALAYLFSPKEGIIIKLIRKNNKQMEVE